MPSFLQYLKKKALAVRARIPGRIRGRWGNGGECPTATPTGGDGAEREDRPPSYHEQDPAPWPAAAQPATQPAAPSPQPASNRGTSGGDAATCALWVTNASETEVSEAASPTATFESDEEGPDVEAASFTATMGDEDEAEEL